MVFSSFWTMLVEGVDSRSGDSYQLVKDAFIQLPFPISAVPHLLIVLFEAAPVCSKLGQAILVNILQPESNEIFDPIYMSERGQHTHLLRIV